MSWMVCDWALAFGIVWMHFSKKKPKVDSRRRVGLDVIGEKWCSIIFPMYCQVCIKNHFDHDNDIGLFK